MGFYMTVKDTSLAPMIAIIGCDGSGKSTVSEQVLACASEYSATAVAHLGKQAGNVGRAITRWPLIGGLFGRALKKSKIDVRKRREKKLNPSFVSALVKYVFTLRRTRRFRRMLALRDQGLIIITDRFPQLDFPEAFDGPELDVNAQGSFIVRWFARSERAKFEWMTSYKPDLVIRLNVDIDTAMERKPDHDREALSRKIDVVPKLTFQGAPIVDIDTTQPLEDVVAAAKAAVSDLLTARGYKRANS
jgi:thymidylate kinase